MAERRMFSKTVTESDSFYCDISVEAQCLYFHLSMNADDDGFVNTYRKIMRMLNVDEETLKELINARFIIYFDSGVIAIKHWKINNYIQKDRYTETVYKTEKANLYLKKNKAYTLDQTKGYPLCIQDVSSSDSQFSLVKVRLEKLNKTKLNLYYLYIIGKNLFFEEENKTFEQIENEKISAIHTLKKMGIFVKDPAHDEKLPEKAREDYIYQYWAIKELDAGEYKSYINYLTREIFLEKYLKAEQRMSKDDEVEFLSYFIKSLINAIKEIHIKKQREQI